MKLLICTQKVDKDDPILGFFHRWIIEFAKHVEELTVICLEEGSYSLPSNVHVISLGKERGRSIAKYIFRFYKAIYFEKGKYDSVFVHMNPEYVLLAGIPWRLWNKKIVMWYTHKNVDLKLRIIEKMVNIVATASVESFRLLSKKVRIVGHGIDTELFSNDDNSLRQKDGVVVIGTAGRISDTKQILLIIESARQLATRGERVLLRIAGTSVTPEEKEYEAVVRSMASEEHNNLMIELLGKVIYVELPKFYKTLNLFVNLSRTGSLDKAVLEAMAMEVPVLTSNEAFKNIVHAESFINDLSPVALSERMRTLLIQKPKGLRQYIIEEHNLSKLVGKLYDLLSDSSK